MCVSIEGIQHGHSIVDAERVKLDPLRVDFEGKSLFYTCMIIKEERKWGKKEKIIE